MHFTKQRFYPSSTQAEEQEHGTKRQETLYIFVGGAGDQHIGLIKRLIHHFHYKFLEKSSTIFHFFHYEKSKIIECLKGYSPLYKQTTLVAHSWGANTSIKLLYQNTNLTVDLLISLDPVGYFSCKSKSPNIKKWINVFIDPQKSSYQLSNIVAKIGRPWLHNNAADINIDVLKNWENLSSTKPHHASVVTMFTAALNSLEKASL